MLHTREEMLNNQLWFCVCLASQVQNQMASNKETIPLETHEDEVERMRQEVQQCREFIHAQQQLLQVSIDYLVKWSACLLKVKVNVSFLFIATAKHIIWWWDGSSPQRLLYTGGEGAAQRGMEALWRAEEKLWEGEKELHRGCYSIRARSMSHTFKFQQVLRKYSNCCCFF